MIPFSLTEKDADIAKVARKTHKSRYVRQRMNVLCLLDMGYSRTETARIVGCHINSVTNYIKCYVKGGLTALYQLNYSKARHQLHTIYDQVSEELNEANCCTTAEASALLQSKFDYNRSNEAVRQLLHRLGFRHRKSGTFPGKIDDFEQWQAKQEAFIKKLEDLMQLAGKEELDLVFADAAHFVYGKFSHYCWSKNPTYTPSGHGRYRINVYGIYDVITNQVYAMYNKGSVDADFMMEYLHWLREECYTDQQRPLHVVLDNARYQHCDMVKQCANRLNIILEFLPGYSPNLNLIERLWKYLKKNLAKQYHRCKDSFEQAIGDLLESLELQEHQEKLSTLLRPKFQTFEKSQILTC